MLKVFVFEFYGKRVSEWIARDLAGDPITPIGGGE